MGERASDDFCPDDRVLQIKASIDGRDVEEITFLPQARTEIPADDVPMFDKFMAMLNDCDDVQDIYRNAIRPS